MRILVVGCVILSALFSNRRPYSRGSGMGSHRSGATTGGAVRTQPTAPGTQFGRDGASGWRREFLSEVPRSAPATPLSTRKTARSPASFLQSARVVEKGLWKITLLDKARVELLQGRAALPRTYRLTFGTRPSENGPYSTFDVGELDHLLPFFGLGRDHRAKILRRRDQRLARRVRPAACGPRDRPSTRVDFPVQLGDDLRRGFLRCAHAEQRARLVAGNGLGDGGHIGQFRRPRRRRHRKRTQGAAADMSDDGGHVVEHHLNTVAEQVGGCRRRAAIGHMQHLRRPVIAMNNSPDRCTEVPFAR